VRQWTWGLKPRHVSAPSSQLVSHSVAELPPIARQYLIFVGEFMVSFTSVPTLVEQSQLVGVGDGDFLMQIIMKQAIDGGFLEQAEAQNL
jgi:hypothetical protein